MGSTAGVAVDDIVLGAALVLFGFFVVFSVIPFDQAPVIAAAGVAVGGAYLMLMRHRAALGLLLAAAGIGGVAFLLGLV